MSMILAFIVGSLFGCMVMYFVMNEIVEELWSLIHHWRNEAIENMQMLLKEKSRHRDEHDDREDADWWKN